ncbi:BTB/POZ and TAZ domain-containing protein 2 [Capsicum annuum]|uniref:BTB/POZ and TAZ domain-containing protein 2 n=2 Tax=Capsicum annuum TaxID=4072 RepID=A0A1U8HCU6_CAPAN|nr:BTB/POZ and TAZ domain-containing protein 1 isoform X1 [Capsicum annuum]KAF3613899.1 BTB/POZ and TAZ domain-containing protein 2 [Capsicum annuum]PHT63282.1 BTB/POZ and TAZ domain-containing protein 2 [Capsicum annuum]
MSNSFASDANGIHGGNEMAESDVQIITSGGLRIPAHSNVLSTASRILENILVGPQSYEKKIRILGVPCNAVSVFVQFLYSFKCTEEQMEKHGIHLLALSHVYLVPLLKHRCTKALAEQLTIENVVDMLQLARLCDTPHLYLKSMKFLRNNFRKVEETEGWKFLQHHDPLLELEILQFMDEAESRKKRRRRHTREQNLYLQLSEGMDRLEHICSEGCTSVGPYDSEYSCQEKLPCSKFDTCRGLQLLIRHFSTCNSRAKGGCSQCKRMWQLLRLHASICDQLGDCRVPLCREFKQKVEKRGGDDELWKSLVRKVVSARAISSLSLPKRKRVEEPRLNLRHHQTRRFRLKNQC